MVIVAIFALRVWIIPNTNDSSTIATQLVDAVDPVTQVPDFSAINDITEKKKAFFDFLRPIVQQQNAIISIRYSTNTNMRRETSMLNP